GVGQPGTNPSHDAPPSIVGSPTRREPTSGAGPCPGIEGGPVLRLRRPTTGLGARSECPRPQTQGAPCGLLPQPGGFEGVLAVEEDSDAPDLAVGEVVDVPG